MKDFQKGKLISFTLLFLALVFCLPSHAQLISPLVTAEQENEDEEKKNLEPPEIVLNDQKVIFNRKPVLDSEGWLYPLEEIAAKLQDKVVVDLLNGTITIQRLRDKSIVQLNVRNGTVTVNNTPFRILFGFNRIILSSDVQMVPQSALVMLLRLTSFDNEEGKLILKNTIYANNGAGTTIQPLARNSIKDLLVDYLTATNSFNYLQSQGLYSRRSEISSGFHNDRYALTSDFITKSGTGAPLINFDSANFSFYKNASPLQVHVGDKPLSLIKSPLIGGITLRGVQFQTAGGLKDSRFTFASGVLPTNGKVLGKNLPFIRYGRLTEVAEWSTSPKKNWQFSAGEAIYNDILENQLVRTKQSGGLFALSATKTGKYLEADSNLAFGIANDKLFRKGESGPGADLLIRFKPKDWLSFFGKGAYYSPGFFPLSGNPYYNNRNEATFGINFNPPRSNIGISHSVGRYNLDAKKPNEYGITNLSFSSTPFKNGPTFISSYSKNESQVSSTRALDNVLFPINQSNISTVDLDTLIERRTNSFFRASVLKNYKTINLSSSFNYFTFALNNPLKTPLLGSEDITTLWTYDFNINKYLNKYLGIQNYFQGSELYKQVRFGINVGPILQKRLNFQLQTGALLQADSGATPLYSLNLNYQVNKKNQLSVNFDKTAYQTSLSTLWQYNLKPTRGGSLPQIGEEQSIGRIKGQVLVLEEAPKTKVGQDSVYFPQLNRERGITDVRIHLGNYTIATDEHGYFEFPSLTPGVHKLRVEYSDLPSYLTSITPESVDVNVEAGKETNFNFVLAYFGQIKGGLQLANEPDFKLEKEPELQDIRVYLEGTEFEALTNIDGVFVLGDVKPGKYKLKVDPEFLPEELEVENTEIDLEVHGKEEVSNIQLPIKYKIKEKQIKEF